jgi:hypothetical protein
MKNLHGAVTEPLCERTYVELRVYLDEGDPTVITARLGVAPTDEHVAGTLHPTILGTSVPHPLTAWFLSSEGVVNSLDVRDHLDWLLRKLDGRSAQVHALAATRGLQMRLTCVWWSASDGGSFTLTAKQMQLLGSLGLDLEFDLAFYGPEEPPKPGNGQRSDAG